MEKISFIIIILLLLLEDEEAEIDCNKIYSSLDVSHCTSAAQGSIEFRVKLFLYN